MDEPHIVDRNKGGFYDRIVNDLTVYKEAPRGGILCSRILWTYSKAFRLIKDEKYIEIATWAYDALNNQPWDEQYSGIYWQVDNNGIPVDSKKMFYSQAFALYGLSEYFLATENTDAKDKAIELFKIIEKNGYDVQNKGYFEGSARDWTPALMHLDSDYCQADKTMNTHLYILEAYTNLIRAWDDDNLKVRQCELINVMLAHIVNQKTGLFNFGLSSDWSVTSKIISYGHDIEGSWLLYEAAEVLEDKQLLDTVKSIAIKMADSVFDEGFDSDGAIFWQKDEAGRLDRQKGWWVQAEGMVGFFNAWQLTRDTQP